MYGGHEHVLRQTLIALAASHKLDEHDNPGEATLQVLYGRVRLNAGDVAGKAPPAFDRGSRPIVSSFDG